PAAVKILRDGVELMGHQGGGRSGENKDGAVVGHLGLGDENDFFNLEVLALEALLKFVEATGLQGFVGVGLALADSEAGGLAAARLDQFHDAVGDGAFIEVGDVAAGAGIAAVLQVRGIHGGDFEALGELGMLVGIDQLIGNQRGGVGILLVE